MRLKMHKLILLITSILITGSMPALSQEKNIPPGGGIGGTGHTTESDSNKDLVIKMNTHAHQSCGEDLEIGKIIYFKNNETSPNSLICGGSSIKTNKNDYLVIDLKENQSLTILGKSHISFDKEMELKIGKNLPLFKFNDGKGRIQRKVSPSGHNLFIESHDSIVEIIGTDIEIQALNFQTNKSTETKEVSVRAYKGSAWIHIEQESLFVGEGYIGKLVINDNNKLFTIKKDVGQSGGRIPIKPD